MRLAWPFRRDPTRDRAHDLYVALTGQARLPAFYGEGRVGDDLQGRYELLLLHAMLVVRRLGRIGPDGQTVAQVLFDVLFDDMDRALREMGIADLAVSRRIKGMAAAFYGRAKAYEDALAAGGPAIEEALQRNLFAGRTEAAPALPAFAAYLAAADQALAGQADQEILAGRLHFPAPPA